MALNDILTSMDGARDALVTAINAKGGSLADNATLYQCADAVGSLSGGTSAEYYKCASVDTEAKTWSGYKAVWGDNGYTISDDLTEGLVYSGMTPQVGTIYDSTCSVKVISLYNSSAKEPVNPFFYSSFTEDLQKEVDPGFKNWGISDISKASFEIVDGISCLKLNNTGLGCDINSKWYTGEHAISFSFGLRLTETHTARKLLMFFDSNDGYDGYGIAVTGTSLQMCGKENSYNVGDAVPLALNTWYHILMTYSIGGLWQLYVNGELKASGTNTINISYNRYQFCFGNYIWNSSYRDIYACLTRVRIYDYVISDPLEMKWLMQEIGVS